MIEEKKENSITEKYLHLMPHPPKLMLGAVGLFLLVLSLNYLLDTVKIYKSIKAERKTISISAEGKVLAAPDLASLSVSVITENKDPKKVEEENTKKTNAIIDFIKSKGVKGEDIKTSNYSLTPRYYYPYDYPRVPCPLPGEVVSPKIFSCPPKLPLIIGYELNQSISVKARDFKTIGDIISGSIERGANQVGNVSFSIEDIDKLKNEARKMALSSAKAKAKDLAKTAGVELGRVVTFSEGEMYIPQPRYYGAGEIQMLGKADSASAPSLEPGTEEIRVTMNVTFELDN